MNMIRIQPAPGRRQAFARWAVAQRPKVRTVSPHEFAVPPALYADVPEELLQGSLVDGHRYISPQEEEPHAAVPAGVPDPAPADPPPPPPAPSSAATDWAEFDAGDLVGVATPEGMTTATPATAVLPEREAVPGDPLPEVPPEAYGPEATPLEPATAHGDFVLVPAQPAPADGDVDGFGCRVCDRAFTTARGRDTHERRVHREA